MTSRLITIFLLGCLFPFGCRDSGSTSSTNSQPTYLKLNGKTMGTTYHLTVQTNRSVEKLQTDIHSLLDEMMSEVNTYLDTSMITRFNQSENGIVLDERFVSSSTPGRHFLMNYYQSKAIAEKTAGHFDPTVMPLVKYWGFAKEKRAVNSIDKKIVDSLLQYVGMDKIDFNEQTRELTKTAPGVNLDFSAIAKGYGVDAIAEMLEQKGVDHYFIEIGGEVRTKGQSPRQQPWIVGISTPSSDAAPEDLKAQIKLSNLSLASSGNYRNYYEVNGRKYGHTIDPKTGLPKQTDLLSASIFSEDCMTADAYATACMVMGMDKAYTLIEQTDGLEGYFIFGNEAGKMEVKYTKGMADILVFQK